MSATSGARQARDEEPELYEPGRRYRRATGVRHVFRLPADWLTVAFMTDSTSTLETCFPRYTLRSTDGDYEKVLTAKDDTVAGDRRRELRFESLPAGKQYTLTVEHDENFVETIFERMELSAIVDQPRAMHELMDQHGYAAANAELGPSYSVDEWRDARAQGAFS